MPTTNYHWSSVLDCVMHETDGAGTTTVDYTHEPTPYGPLLSERRAGAESIHHYDALGSTTALTDEAGDVTDTFQYDAWGNTVARAGTTPTKHLWNGRWGYQLDLATGSKRAYNIRERVYDPVTSRWTSLDRIAIADANDAYRYVMARPVDHADPSGLILVAIDGTGSKEFRSERQKAKSGPKFGTLTAQSHVWRWVLDYKGTEKYFDDGPTGFVNGIYGGDAKAIENKAYTSVCNLWCTKKTPAPECRRKKIDLVGHSRGAYIVMQLARRFQSSGCTCNDGKTGVPSIRFIGLYDPVDMAPTYPETPLNHDAWARGATWAIALAKYFINPDGSVGGMSRATWRRPITTGPAAVERQPSGSVLRLEATHSAIGGASGWGDKPKGWTMDKDIKGAIAADRYIRSRAVMARVPISMLTDEQYGYM